jgi:hypothetical protein
VKFYGSSYSFTLYALSLVASGPFPAEQTFRIDASESFSGSASLPSVQTLAVSGFHVSAGDLLAFAGIGPYYTQNPNDALHSDATYQDRGRNDFIATPPSGPLPFTVGANGDPTANYNYVPNAFGNQGRNYGIGVDLTPSVPDSGSTLLLLAPIMAVLAAMKRRCFSRA